MHHAAGSLLCGDRACPSVLESYRRRHRRFCEKAEGDHAAEGEAKGSGENAEIAAIKSGESLVNKKRNICFTKLKMVKQMFLFV